MNANYQEYLKLAKQVELPASFIDLDLINQNLRALLKRSGDKHIRIASKSIRSIEVLKHIFSFSKQFKGIMAFTLKEAVFLIEQGFDDILLGYPDLQEGPLNQVLDHIKKGKKIVLMVDLPEHLQIVERLAKAKNVKATVCLDVDMSIDFKALWFGVYRSSVRNQKGVKDFLAALQNCAHIDLVGLMGYEAQIAGVMDDEKGNFAKNVVVRLLKKIAIPKVAKRRKQAVELIEQHLGKKLTLINAGGTGSLESSIQEPWVSEVTVGSGIYNSHLFDGYQNFKHQPAAFYALQVVRNPDQNTYVAHGGGYIASGSVEQAKAPLPYLPKDMKLFANEGAGEVQTPFKYNDQLKLGQPVFFRHAKAGELFERFNYMHVISQGKIISKFSTYRGNGCAFL